MWRRAALVLGQAPRFGQTRKLAARVYFEGREPSMNVRRNPNSVRFAIGLAACGGVYYVTHLETTPVTGTLCLKMYGKL